MDPSLVETPPPAWASRSQRAGSRKTILLLPGSRSSEIRQLLPVFEQAALELSRRSDRVRYLLPTVPQQEALVRSLIENWSVKPDVFMGQDAKWEAFTEADGAMACLPAP